MVRISLFAALIAVGAFIRIPSALVPNTLQFLFTTLAGVLLGSKRGALSVLLYLAIGLAGVPVFAGGGGIAYVLQPTFGYLIGFAVGAYATGRMAERPPEAGVARLILANFVGMLIVYGLGVLYFWLIQRFYLGNEVAARTLLVNCFLLTVPGDLAYCVVAALLAKRLRSVLNREPAAS